MERPFENHHYQHHWQHGAPHPPHPPPHPNFYHHPPQQHQHLYFSRQDHFVEHNNAPHFNHPIPDVYPNFSNNHMTTNEPNDSFGGFCSNGRKRARHFSDPKGDASHAKLYVAPVPTTTTEENIRPLFEEHGYVVEVVFPRDKRNGQRHGYCFLKYATMEEADGAIRALNGQYTFPGEVAPIKVKYADREREHLVNLERERFLKGEREHGGGGEVLGKLYVGSIDKHASQQELVEIFSPFGLVEDVFIARDLETLSRGYAFIKYPHRDMAVAAIKALNGTFTMRGCDQPLIVRFADPKKRKSGGDLRPAPSFGHGVGGCSLPNPSYPMQEIPMYSQPQAVPQTMKLAVGTPPMIEQALPLVKQPIKELCQMPPQDTHPQKNFLQSSQQALPEVKKQTHTLDQQQSAQVPLECSFTGSKAPVVDVTSAAPVASLSPRAVDPEECDWSEHTCPDGYKYYYNCMTNESRWGKPDELTSFQQQLLKQQKVLSASQRPHPPSMGFCGEALDQIQKEVDQVKIQSANEAI